MEIKKITDNLWEVKAKFSRKSDKKAFEKWLNERFNEQPTKQKGAETMTDREKIKEELFNYIIRVLQGKTSNAKETEMLPVLMETYFRFR